MSRFDVRNCYSTSQINVHPVTYSRPEYDMDANVHATVPPAEEFRFLSPFQKYAKIVVFIIISR